MSIGYQYKLKTIDYEITYFDLISRQLLFIPDTQLLFFIPDTQYY